MTKKYSNKLIDIAAKIVDHTEKAIKVDDGVTKAWLPRSQIEVEGVIKLGSTVTITLPLWLLEEKKFVI